MINISVHAEEYHSGDGCRGINFKPVLKTGDIAVGKFPRHE
jgi:hypothetical protein